MIKKTALLLVCSAFLVTQSGQAALKSEFSGGMRADLGWILDPANTLVVDVSGAYYRALHRNVLLGGATSLAVSTEAATAVSWYTLVGPTFSFGGKSLADDFFLRTGVGLLLRSNVVTQTSFVLGATLGKRFKFLGNVAYSPSVTFLVPTQDNVSFQFRVLEFSILL